MDEKTFKFEFTENEANIVLSGLSELPVKVSLGVIQKIQGQAQGQIPEQVTEASESNPQLLTEG